MQRVLIAQVYGSDRAVRGERDARLRGKVVFPASERVRRCERAELPRELGIERPSGRTAVGCEPICASRDFDLFEMMGGYFDWHPDRVYGRSAGVRRARR